MHKGRNIALLLAMTLIAGTAISCRKDLGSTDGNDTKAGNDTGGASLSLSLGSQYSPLTKMSEAAVQVNAASSVANFRGMDIQAILPFSTGSTAEVPVTDDQAINEGPITLRSSTIAASSYDETWSSSSDRLVRNNQARLYELVHVPRGTDAVLVYGRAKPIGSDSDLDEYRRTNGVLEVTAFADRPDDITFSPVQIVGADDKAELLAKAEDVAAFLTSIANASVSFTGYVSSGGSRVSQSFEWKFSTITNPSDIENCYSDFINAGQPIACSRATISRLLTILYNKLYTHANNNESDYRQGYYSNRTGGSMQYYYYARRVSERVRELISNGPVTMSGSGNNRTVTLTGTYASMAASSLGIPDGAMALRWNGTAFEVASTVNNTRLVDMEDYCYPPDLWYFTNSTVRTADEPDGVIHSWYTSSNSWSAVLANYDAGTRVMSNTTGVAVTKPLQYGQGLLALTLSPCATKLEDNTPDTPLMVDVNNTNFPVTGLIIGDQHVQTYNFHPLSGNVRYIYDSKVSGAYISSTASQSTMYTLVLETLAATCGSENEKDASVHFALEFSNNSNVTFVGATGNVLPGSKFYLTGTLTLADATQDGSKLGTGVRTSIFRSGCKTAITLKISDLKAAYNTVPDLRDPQLELGVQVIMDWIESTPSDLPMY